MIKFMNFLCHFVVCYFGYCVRLVNYSGERVVGNNDNLFPQVLSLTGSTIQNCCVSTFTGSCTR